jgi:hypothetical protein
MASIKAATTCCGSTAAATLRGPSLVAVSALPATRGALDEHRLVGTDASSLSAFAGARGGGRSAPPYERKIEKIKLTPRNRVSGRVMAYLTVEKPRFLFLQGSAGAEATTDAATIAPPDASAARAGTSAARTASSVDCPAAGAPTPSPGACSSAALGEGGVGSHLS